MLRNHKSLPDNIIIAGLFLIVLRQLQVFSNLTGIEFPEVIEVSVEAGVIASKYIQLSIVGNCIQVINNKNPIPCFIMKINST